MRSGPTACALARWPASRCWPSTLDSVLASCRFAAMAAADLACERSRLHNQFMSGGAMQTKSSRRIIHTCKVLQREHERAEIQPLGLWMQRIEPHGRGLGVVQRSGLQLHEHDALHGSLAIKRAARTLTRIDSTWGQNRGETTFGGALVARSKGIADRVTRSRLFMFAPDPR